MDQTRSSSDDPGEILDLEGDLSDATADPPEADGAEPEPQSDNWTLEMVDKLQDPLMPDDPRRRTSPTDLVLTSYLALLLGAGITYVVFHASLNAEGPGWPVTIAVLAVIVVGLVPQIAYALPLRLTPWAALLFVAASGVLSGTTFSLLAWFIDPVVVGQVLVVLGVMLFWTPILGLLGWLRGPVERNVLLLLGVSLGTVWLGMQATHTPWIVPFLSEHGKFQALSPEGDWMAWIRWLLPRVIAAVLMVVTLTFCARQAATDWRQVRLRVHRGLPRIAAWSSASILASVVPMLAFFILSFLSSRGRSQRD